MLMLLFSSITSFSQVKMRTLDELINTVEPGWIHVKTWIDAAKNKVEVLSVDTISAKEALFNTQVTTRSPMGAIVYMTGGLLVNNGWIRILGSGNPKLIRKLPDWNKGKTFNEYGQIPQYLLIADDAIGGFFLLNGGGLGKDVGGIYYFSPDNLMYEPLNMNYSELLNFCFNGNLNDFYKGNRWGGWKEDILTLSGDEVFSFFPYLWSKEGKKIKKNTRKIVPIEEQYIENLNFRIQMGLDK